jgi:hypothetical protein
VLDSDFLKGATVTDHYVYVILLSDDIGPRVNAELPSVYVGQSARPPKERFEQHKSGYKASRHVKNHGVRLLPKLYRDLNPIYSDERYEVEENLADQLRDQGYTVYGGH